jgi:hypothetical protein
VKAYAIRVLVLLTLATPGACAPGGAPASSAAIATVPSLTPRATTAIPASATGSPIVAALVGEPTISLFLPYLTKTLGGPDGWETPFIVQNADTVPADLEVNLYAIADGRLVTRRIVRGLKPGTSSADRPNQDADLPDNGAYSAVVRSFGAKIVAVVNQQRGLGTRFEADSYVSQIGGAASVFLPSAVKGVGGFVSRIAVQNVGIEPTVATAVFTPADGESTTIAPRTIEPGRSIVIDMTAESGLPDGAYAVRISAAGRLVAIANTEREARADTTAMLYSYVALDSGANTVYGPYAVKNVPGVGAGSSTISVQNMGRAVTRPTLTFTPLGAVQSTAFIGPTLEPGASWSFDLRFGSGDPRRNRCGRTLSTGCLADGEYSWTVGAPGAQLAALVTVIGATTAASYTGLSRPADVFLPNVTRTLGGRDGWTTVIIAQSVSASRLTLSWYRFADGTLVATQRLTIVPGSAIRIDPREVPGLSDDSQYSVVIAGDGGRLVAVVVQLNFQGGDGAAIYTGFFR